MHAMIAKVVSLVSLVAEFPLTALVASTTTTSSRQTDCQEIPPPPYLGNISPWHARSNTSLQSLDPPPGFRVDQVHMVSCPPASRDAGSISEADVEGGGQISRHAETYPDVQFGASVRDLMRHIRSANVTLRGSLAFANSWEHLSDDPNEMGNLITTGPYAGTLEAFNTGTKLRTRYKHLLNTQAEKPSFWTSDFGRVKDSARLFASGLWGLQWATVATLRTIPEGSERGANTLTPSKTCLKFAQNWNAYGHDYGDRMSSEFRLSYIFAIVTRLAQQHPGIVFTADEVFCMQMICGFETVARGQSSWCGLFTDGEMKAFEYARDLVLYYRSGPGNPFAATMGYPWLNATVDLLTKSIDSAPLYFSFAHDSDVLNIVTALRVYQTGGHLPTTYVPQQRAFHGSETTPMGGRIILERLVRLKEHDHGVNDSEMLAGNVFVRININDAIVALPDCDSGPGRSCPLDEFVKRTRDTGIMVGDFVDACGLAANAAKRINFLHH